MERDTIIAMIGGTGGSLFSCLMNPVWLGQVIIGALIGAIISFFVVKFLRWGWSKLRIKN